MSVEALVKALEEIAREQSAKTATAAADKFQTIAREALAAYRAAEELKDDAETLARDIIAYCLEHDVLTQHGMAGLRSRLKLAISTDAATIHAAMLRSAATRMDSESHKHGIELDVLASAIEECEKFPEEIKSATPPVPDSSLEEAAKGLIDYIPAFETRKAYDKTDEAHLRWMLNEIISGRVSGTKGHRWLGFVQGVLAARGYIDVDGERERTRKLFALLPAGAGEDVVERAAKALWEHRVKEIRSTGGFALDWEKLALIFRIETCIEAEVVLRAAGLPEAVPGWRPIETAPKDGTEVYLPLTFKEGVKAFFCNDLKKWVLSRELFLETVNNPKVWRPLRSAPATAQPTAPAESGE